MKMNKYFIELGIAGVLASSLPAMSEDAMNIKWDSLNLSSKQKLEIQTLDIQWKNVHSSVRPKLTKDQEKLKTLLGNPDISEDQLRTLQRQIFLRKEQLRNEAMENFLSKRRLLNSQQREKLHKMMSE